MMAAYQATSPMRQLLAMRHAGLQPERRELWCYLDLEPPRRNALQIDSGNIPSEADCAAVAGLDVIVCFHGHSTSYGALRKLCGSLFQARPRRLIAIDLDYKRLAFLKLGRVHG